MDGERYLLDASAIYPLVLRLEKSLFRYVERFAVLDLTVYEVGNVLWKEFKKGRIRNLEPVVTLFEELFSYVEVLRPRIELGKVIKLVVEEGLTFYDASYLYIARTSGMRLVTEDSDLLKFPESISVDELLRELGVMQELPDS